MRINICGLPCRVAINPIAGQVAFSFTQVLSTDLTAIRSPPIGGKVINMSACTKKIAKYPASAVPRHQLRRHRLIFEIRKSRGRLRLRSLLRLKLTCSNRRHRHSRTRHPPLDIPARMGPPAKMPCPTDHLFVPLRQNHQVPVLLVQHHPMVRNRFLHVAFFALAGLNQRHGFCPFASSPRLRADQSNIRCSLYRQLSPFL